MAKKIGKNPPKTGGLEDTNRKGLMNNDIAHDSGQDDILDAYDEVLDTLPEDDKWGLSLDEDTDTMKPAKDNKTDEPDKPETDAPAKFNVTDKDGKPLDPAAVAYTLIRDNGDSMSLSNLGLILDIVEAKYYEKLNANRRDRYGSSSKGTAGYDEYSGRYEKPYKKYDPWSSNGKQYKEYDAWSGNGFKDSGLSTEVDDLLKKSKDNAEQDEKDFAKIKQRLKEQNK